MTRNNYFQELKATSKLVDPFISNYIHEENYDNPSRSFVQILPEKRLGKPRIRDLLLRLSYEIAGGDDWQSNIPPYAAAIEIYNDSTYIVNWFLDGKGYLKTRDDEKRTVIAGFLLRELAQKIIQQQKESEVKKLAIISGLNEVNSYIYQSQNFDLYKLTIERFKEFENPDVYLPLLYEKGRLACGYFSRWIVETGLSLADGSDEDRRILGDFAINLSAGIQLANDAGDFIPSCKGLEPVDKSYKDQFTDIANGRLTLSTWYCLRYGTDEQKRALLNLVGRRDVAIEEKENVVYALRDSGAFNFIFQESKKIMKQCQKNLHQLPRSEERDLLETMASITKTNKFYSILKKHYCIT